MLSKIIDFSIRNKLIVILFTLTIAGFGLYSVFNIPLGAVPDITNNQVQVITTSGNLSTQEIEQYITAPVEMEMVNLPGVEEIRSVSKFGLSVVTIVFKDKLGTYLPRQLISEKISAAAANIPEGFGTPEMGPITTGLGEIYQYVLDVKPGYEDRYSPMELRTIQDWIVRRQLSGINGVVEVNSWGGYLKQYEVAVQPARLRSLNITLMDVFSALENNNSITGGGYIEKSNQAYFIRGDGQINDLSDIGNIVIKNTNGIPVYIKDIAVVHYGYANRYGAITANGEGEKVLGQIMMLKDGNSKVVINEVKSRVEKIQKNLPEGVYINPILERSELISKTTLTIAENLIFGCLIVVFIVILLLGNLRSALVIASMIPLSLFFTLSMMYIFGIDANLMSLGALDFGIIIDGAVIIVEFITLQLLKNSNELKLRKDDQKKIFIDRISYEGAAKMMKSAIFGQVIILIVFIPILSLSGVEGKMFKPMALSFSFAIIGAMILGLTWLPVASSLFLKPKMPNDKNLSKRLMNLAYRSYRPVIEWSISHKPIVLSAAVISLIVTFILFNRMGGEFVPTLDEGDFVIQPVLKTGTSLSKTIELTTRMEQILIDKFPEVDQIVCRIGAAEVPTDPMSMEEIDMIIKLIPKKEWTSSDSKEGLANLFKEELSIIPGIDYEFTQPIEMRFNELITGVRADIAIKIFGENLDYLSRKAIEIKGLIKDVPGAADVIIEKTAGLPQMNVTYKRDKIAYYNIDIKTLNSYLSMAFGGDIVGSVFEGEKRFDLAVRLDSRHRTDIEDIKMLQVPLENGQQVALNELADIFLTKGPAKISRDNGQRRVVVSVNTRNRDLQSVVEDIESIINKNVKLAPGYQIAYGGQFENLTKASNRLMVAVPVALLLIFIFLHFAFKSFKDALLIFTAVPLATVGGVFLLWVRGMPFSISAGIGFIALFGIAVLNGIVLIEHLKELLQEGETDLRKLILKGTKNRFRPVILTASAAALGFLPMAVSTGAGAEVQRPLATVVIGGLVTSTMLTMIALPLLYEIFNKVKGIQLWPLKLIKYKTLVFIGLLTMTTVSVTAQSKTINLGDAIDIAVQNNRNLNAYRLMIEEQKALKSTAFDIDKANLFYSYDENNVADNGYPLEIIGIEQSFSFPTVYSSQYRANKTLLKKSESEFRTQFYSLMNDVSKTYYKIQYLLNKKSLLMSIDSLYRQLSQHAEINFIEGGINRLDYLNVLSKKQQVEIKVKENQYDLEIEYDRLNLFLNDTIRYIIPQEQMTLVAVDSIEFDLIPAIQTAKLESNLKRDMLKVQRNYMLPDISLAYFNGTNKYVDAKNYYGFEVGLSVPLFFGSYRSNINAAKIAVGIQDEKLQNQKLVLKTRYKELVNELRKSEESINNYKTSGKQLVDEILLSSNRSYQLGEIDFFKFVISFESAMELTLNYYDNVLQYNVVATEINYLTE